MTIRVLSFDYIGCLINDQSIDYSHDLIFLGDDLVNYFKGSSANSLPSYMMIGSLDQNPSPQALDSLKQLATDLTLKFDPLLLNDILENLPDGTTSHQLTQEIRPHKRELPPSKYSGLLASYAQIHKIAGLHREQPIQFELYTSHLFGRDSFFGSLMVFFEQHPEMIPDNVSLHFIKIPEVHDEYPSGINTEQVIRGTGPIDWNYRATVAEMAQITQNNPLKLPDVRCILPGENLHRKDPSITLQLKGSIKLIRSTDEALSAKSALLTEAMKRGMQATALNNEDGLLFNEAITHFSRIATPTDLWQFCIPENIDTCGQHEINNFFINLCGLTESANYNTLWIQRLESYLWITRHYKRLEALVNANKKLNQTMVSYLRSQGENLTQGGLFIQPVQRIPKLGLFVSDWLKLLGNGFLPENHPALTIVKGFDLKIRSLLQPVNQLVKLLELEEQQEQRQSSGFHSFLFGKKPRASVIDSASITRQFIERAALPIASTSNTTPSSSQQVTHDLPASEESEYRNQLLELESNLEHQVHRHESEDPVVLDVSNTNSPADLLDPEDKSEEYQPPTPLKSQVELASLNLNQLKSNLLNRIKSNHYPVQGGWFAGTPVVLEDGTSKRIPAHLSLILSQIRRFELRYDTSFATATHVIGIAMMARSQPHNRRHAGTSALYDGLLEIMNVDVSSSLRAIQTYLNGLPNSYWQTRIHLRPTTVTNLMTLLDNGDLDESEKLKQIMGLIYKAYLSNGRRFNLRSDNTETFYENVIRCLVFKQELDCDFESVASLNH
jgi:hypothetical protein